MKFNVFYVRVPGRDEHIVLSKEFLTEKHSVNVEREERQYEVSGIGPVMDFFNPGQGHRLSQSCSEKTFMGNVKVQRDGVVCFLALGEINSDDGIFVDRGGIKILVKVRKIKSGDKLSVVRDDVVVLVTREELLRDDIVFVKKQKIPRLIRQEDVCDGDSLVVERGRNRAWVLFNELLLKDMIRVDRRGTEVFVAREKVLAGDTVMVKRGEINILMLRKDLMPRDKVFVRRKGLDLLVPSGELELSDSLHFIRRGVSMLLPSKDMQLQDGLFVMRAKEDMFTILGRVRSGDQLSVTQGRIEMLVDGAERDLEDEILVRRDEEEIFVSESELLPEEYLVVKRGVQQIYVQSEQLQPQDQFFVGRKIAEPSVTGEVQVLHTKKQRVPVKIKMSDVKEGDVLCQENDKRGMHYHLMRRGEEWIQVIKVDRQGLIIYLEESAVRKGDTWIDKGIIRNDSGWAPILEVIRNGDRVFTDEAGLQRGDVFRVLRREGSGREEKHFLCEKELKEGDFLVSRAFFNNGFVRRDGKWVLSIYVVRDRREVRVEEVRKGDVWIKKNVMKVGEEWVPVIPVLRGRSVEYVEENDLQEGDIWRIGHQKLILHHGVWTIIFQIKRGESVSELPAVASSFEIDDRWYDGVKHVGWNGNGWVPTTKILRGGFLKEVAVLKEEDVLWKHGETNFVYRGQRWVERFCVLRKGLCEFVTEFRNGDVRSFPDVVSPIIMKVGEWVPAIRDSSNGKWIYKADNQRKRGKKQKGPPGKRFRSDDWHRRGTVSAISRNGMTGSVVDPFSFMRSSFVGGAGSSLLAGDEALSLRHCMSVGLFVFCIENLGIELVTPQEVLDMAHKGLKFIIPDSGIGVYRLKHPNLNWIVTGDGVETGACASQTLNVLSGTKNGAAMMFLPPDGSNGHVVPVIADEVGVLQEEPASSDAVIVRPRYTLEPRLSRVKEANFLRTLGLTHAELLKLSEREFRILRAGFHSDKVRGDEAKLEADAMFTRLSNIIERLQQEFERKIRFVHSIMHGISVGARLVDVGTEAFRCYSNPTWNNGFRLVQSGVYATSVISGITKLSVTATVISVGYTLIVEKDSVVAFEQGLTSYAFMLMPKAIMEMGLSPYAVVVYTSVMTAYSVSVAGSNALSLCKERASGKDGMLLQGCVKIADGVDVAQGWGQDVLELAGNGVTHTLAKVTNWITDATKAISFSIGSVITDAVIVPRETALFNASLSGDNVISTQHVQEEVIEKEVVGRALLNE